MQGSTGDCALRPRACLALTVLVSLLVALPASAHAVVRRVPAPAPAAAAALAAPRDLKVTAGDMADTLSWAPVRSLSLSGYRIESATSPSGPWSTLVARTSAASQIVKVRVPALTYYRVRSIDARGLAGAPGAPVANSTLLMVRFVTSSGATLRASNGALTLTLQPGTFTSATRVGVRDAGVPGTPSVVRVTGSYDFSASGALLKPAKVTVPYRIPVRHFQVANTVAKGIDWMCLDPATGKWAPVTTSVDTTAGTLTAEMPHFSYWIGAFIQPHGTAPSKTDYCGYVCHQLGTEPGSPVVLADSDSQVCYNCHGNAGEADPAAGSSGHNIQAEFYACDGQSMSAGASMHPARLPGATTGLTCASCHDPHKDPAASPKLLRAYDAVTGKAIASANATMPGTPYCWACHGVRKNAKTDAQVPGYWLRTGDKKTTFNGAHSSLGRSTWRYDSETELKRGYTSRTAVRGDGSVAVAGMIMLPKTPTPPVTAVPTPTYYSAPGAPWAAYDGKLATIFQWFAKDMGASGVSPSNPKVGTAYLTIDLGSATSLQAFESYFDTSVGGGAFNTDVLEIRTSDDNVTWQTVATQGTIGTRSANYVYISLAAPVTGRYVRLVFSRLFSESDMHSICPAEVGLYGPPAQGTFEVWPDIARKAAFSGGVVKWASTEPAGTSVAVTVRASTDKGVTWTGWEPVVNGGAITQIAVGASLENARLQVRSTLSGVGTTPILDSLQVSLDRGAITGTTPAWSGASPANQCQRCHTGHASAKGGLVSAGSTASCKNCHVGTYGSSYVGSAAFATSKHAGVACADCHTAHGKPSGAGVDYAFLLKDDRAEACLACHATVKTAFDAKEGVASEWAKHDIRSAQQVTTGSTMACRTCHATHFSSTGLVDPDSPTTAFTATRDDPTSIPTGEIVVYATRDTLIDSTAGRQTWNYGASNTVTITPSTRFLAYFDLSAIPAGATIQHAEFVLWGTNWDYHAYTGGYLLYPMTRDWLEGSGTGTANSSGVNGASWLEWKYDNNANSGNTTAGDWAALGGDRGAAGTYDSGGIAARNVTALVTSLRAGPNYGIMVAPYDAATSLPIYTRDNAGLQMRPKLRIVYRTGPATRQVADDITFCSKCHDGTMPAGLTGQSMSAVASMYQYGVHGAKQGIGPESDAFGYWGADGGGGGLKAPYTYGMDALPCTTCHDPHGSRLPYHLREVINGQSVTPTYGWNWGYETATTGAGLGYFCAACHIFPTNHTGYMTSTTSCSSSCHNHAGK